MKKAAYGIVLSLVLIFSVIILTTIYGRTVRINELEKSTSTALEYALGLINDDEYEFADSNELKRVISDELLRQIKSDSQIIINFLKVDSENGLVSIEVIEKYMHPNGKEGAVSCKKTAVIEKYLREKTTASQMNSITFKVDDMFYKKYLILSGDNYLIPINPVVAGKRFVGWKKSGTGTVFTFNQKRVETDMIFEAVWG